MMDKLFLCTFVVGLLKCVHGSVNVTDLRMPNSIELGSKDEIELECNFQAPENEPGLVIRWFFNGDGLMYQYIPEYRANGTHGDFWKQRIDPEFNVGDDKNAIFKALKIHNISQELTGNYTCKVSSDNNEDWETRQLVVYSPPKTQPDIIVFKSESLVVCTAQGISPEPHMDFYIQTENGTRKDVSEEVDVVSDPDGYFNVTAKHHFNNLTLPEVTIFVCNLSIPGTDYSWSDTWEFRQEESNFTEENIGEELNSNMTSVDNSTVVQESFNETEKTKGKDGANQLRLSCVPVLLLIWVMCFNK